MEKTTKVCPSCRTPLHPNVSTCPQCGNSSVSDQLDRCPNGHIIQDNSKFCSWCGAEAISKCNNEPDRKTEVMPSREGRVTDVWPPKTPMEGRKTIIRAISTDGDQDESKPRVVGFLVSYTLEPQGFFYPLREGRQSIGRDSKDNLHIDDPLLSAGHAIILYRNGRFIFEDKLSSNGTLLNGQEAIGQKELVHGNCLVMGSNTFFFVGVPQDETN